jgi:Histidine kinase-like ATPase domain
LASATEIAETGCSYHGRGYRNRVEAAAVSGWFDPTPDSVRANRGLVGDLPGAMSTALVDNVRLVVSELASNVVRHARTPYQVALRAQSAIRIEVSDRSPAAPRRRDLDLGAATGRGLQIVELCAARRGYELVPRGKVVWAEVPFVVGGGDTSGRSYLPAATHPCSTNTEATQSISGVPGGFVANGLGTETPQASSDRQ